MSITAVLLAYALWVVPQRLLGTRPFGILENNLNQAAASAAAAYQLRGTGRPDSGPHAAHRQDAGMALAGALDLLGGRGRRRGRDRDAPPDVDRRSAPVPVRNRHRRDAARNVRARPRSDDPGARADRRRCWRCFGQDRSGAAFAQALGFAWGRSPFRRPCWRKKKFGAITLKNLGFAFEPSLLFFGVGALIGMRAGVSLLIGVVVGWGILAPWTLAQGYAEPGEADEIWFGSLLKWLLWPGVTLMVTSSLTSFLLSSKTVLRALRGASVAELPAQAKPEETSRRALFQALAGVLVLTVLCQIALFGIKWWIALLAVLLTFVLAIVAGRVTGETGLTPIGPMGKVTQLTFGFISPGDATANLMAANVTGGAASQCGESAP